MQTPPPLKEPANWWSSEGGSSSAARHRVGAVSAVGNSNGATLDAVAEKTPQSLNNETIDLGSECGTEVGAFSAESLKERLDSAWTRFNESGATQSWEFLVQELVSDRCRTIRQELETQYTSIAQELETQYTSIAAVTILLQKQFDSAIANFANELESNKKTWTEEAVRIWEAVDSHTHHQDLNLDPEEEPNKPIPAASASRWELRTLLSITARLDAIENRFTECDWDAIDMRTQELKTVPEEAQSDTLSTLSTPSVFAENFKTLSSIMARLDAVESRLTGDSDVEDSGQSSVARVQELLEETCLIVRQELDTKYASTAADMQLLQRKLESVVAQFNHELESNKKTWTEEAVRIWESFDKHTNQDGSSPTAPSSPNIRLDDIGASLASLARQFPPTPAQQFRSTPQQAVVMDPTPLNGSAMQSSSSCSSGKTVPSARSS